MNRTFIDYYLNAFRYPGRTFGLLLDDDRRFRFGIFFMLAIGHGAPSVFTPWLNIPKEEYYAWNRFLVTTQITMPVNMRSR